MISLWHLSSEALLVKQQILWTDQLLQTGRQQPHKEIVADFSSSKLEHLADLSVE